MFVVTKVKKYIQFICALYCYYVDEEEGVDICRIIPILRCVYSSSWLGVENVSSCVDVDV